MTDLHVSGLLTIIISATELEYFLPEQDSLLISEYHITAIMIYGIVLSEATTSYAVLLSELFSRQI